MGGNASEPSWFLKQMVNAETNYRPSNRYVLVSLETPDSGLIYPGRKLRRGASPLSIGKLFGFRRT